MSHFTLDKKYTEEYNDLMLADRTFYNSGTVDILLGINISLPLLKGQMMKYEEGKPVASLSELGIFQVV
ncbi:hypothetical protein X975_17762, partial [Stegodyphus mimosarum]